jgi:NAD(P)-dependent dehydrogenase (short-subunit alcohol dehydrogenase family)
VVATSRSIKPAADQDIVTVQGDVGAADTAERVFKTTIEKFGRVDTLVNNAGMFMAKPFTLYSPEDYAAYISTNVTGFFHMTQHALQLMGRSHQRGVTGNHQEADAPAGSTPSAGSAPSHGPDGKYIRSCGRGGLPRWCGVCNRRDSRRRASGWPPRIVGGQAALTGS